MNPYIQPMYYLGDVQNFDVLVKQYPPDVANQILSNADANSIVAALIDRDPLTNEMYMALYTKHEGWKQATFADNMYPTTPPSYKFCPHCGERL